jgi:hypothetical protein
MENWYRGGAAMTSKVKALWIDDDLTHLDDARNLRSRRLGVDFSRPEKLVERLAPIAADGHETPDIFLVDYYLNEIADQNHQKYPNQGLTIEAQIRERFPEYPIYLVTHIMTDSEEARLGGSTHAVKSSFDKILTFKEVQRHGEEILYYDALDYRKIRTSPTQNQETLYSLLKAPIQVKEELKLVLPSQLRQGLATVSETSPYKGNAIAFAKWVRDLLLLEPGFLYDDLHTATFLGIKLSGLQKLTDELKKARYSGIFSKTSKGLWWTSKLREIIFSSPRARESTSTSPWEVAPIVFKVPKRDRSVCAICGDSLPETVGINSEDDRDLKPVHYRCSEPHPNKKRELYFDEPRAFRPGN